LNGLYMTYGILLSMPPSYKAPEIPNKKLTTQLVRDELLDCFESANREFSKLQEQTVSDQALKEQVKNFVQSVFNNCGVNFENPTKQGIFVAINQCKANAEKMMGPQGTQIIEHHYNEMMKLVNRLPK
jgi:hypothetical protein